MIADYPGFDSVDDDGWCRKHEWIGTLVLIGDNGRTPAEVTGIKIDIGPHGEMWPEYVSVRYLVSGRRLRKVYRTDLTIISPLAALAVQA